MQSLKIFLKAKEPRLSEENMKLDSNTYKFTDKGKLGNIALTVGIVGLAASAVGYFQDSHQFYFSYLVAFFFWMTVALGALFFNLLHHLTRASWSTVLRKLTESMMSTIPFMFVMMIPVLLGMHELYHWTHEDVLATDIILQNKAAYLNIPFFIIRVVFYFAVWSIMTLILTKNSAKQDIKHEDSILARMRKYSAPGMMLFAFTITFAAFDWLMSLEPHWFSTIFGVYIFCGTFISMLAFTIIMVRYQNIKGAFDGIVTVEHRHTLGKLLFAFTIMWAYMGFSQYLLIWYANMPEETFWYLQRWEGSWRTLSIILPIAHFGLPFVALIPQAAKRSGNWLLMMAFYMLLMRYMDLYWIAMPTHSPDGIHYSWIDISTMAGIGGIFIWLFWRKYTSGAAVPVNDPGLKVSMEHLN